MSNPTYRINHFLSKAGICSRRAADRLIRRGLVQINGHIASVGQKVTVADSVTYQQHEVRLALRPDYFYRLYHKPKGIVVTQNGDVQNNLLSDLLPRQAEGWPRHFFAVGRLDKDSEGVLLLTNHGVLTNQLLQQDKTWPKRYIVTVTPVFDEAFIAAMASGVQILGQTTQACKVFRLADNLFQIELTQGLNRQIRRMCQSLGYRVQRLIRVEFAGLSIQGLPAGGIRPLETYERQKLESIINKV